MVDVVAAALAGKRVRIDGPHDPPQVLAAVRLDYDVFTLPQLPDVLERVVPCSQTLELNLENLLATRSGGDDAMQRLWGLEYGRGLPL